MPASEILKTLVDDFPLTLLAGMICGAMCSYIGFVLKRHGSTLTAISLSQVAVAGIALSYVSWMPSNSLHSSLMVTLVVALALAGQRKGDKDQTTVLLVLFVLALTVRMIIMSRTTQDANFEIETVLKGYVWFVRPPLFYAVLGGAFILLLHAILQRPFLHPPMDSDKERSAGRWKGPVMVLHAITALGVAVSVHAVGDIFVLGFLLLPTLTASMLAQRSSRQFIISIAIGLLVPLAGLFIAFRYDMPPGASSVAALSFGLLIAWVLGTIRSVWPSTT